MAERVNDVWRFLIYDIGGKLIAEYGGAPSTDDGGIKYLLSDWQGSTRAIVNAGGHIQGRMDYTAFGEDIGSGTGLRTTAQGFSNTGNLRQKYGLTERDEATGMDHTWFRKNENRAGRWTSPDPYNGSMSLGDPQSFNRFSYVGNAHTNFIDPSGLNKQGENCTITLSDGTTLPGKTDEWGGCNLFIGNVGTVNVYWSEYWAIIGHGQPDPFNTRDPLNIDTESFGGLDALQTGLDVCGLIPGIGEVADGANAFISLGRGDYTGAALSAGAMIPFVGWGAAGAKFGRTISKSRTVSGYVGDVVKEVGGNPTVQRGGQDLFRIRESGHGISGPSVTPNNIRNITPSGPKPGKGAAVPMNKRHVKELYKALDQQGTCAVRKKGRR